MKGKKLELDYTIILQKQSLNYGIFNIVPCLISEIL